MLASNSLIAFIPTVNAEKAKAFYVGILGLEFIQDDKFALVLKGGSNMIRIVRLESFTPAPYTILGWEVPNLRQEVQRLSKEGISFTRYPFLQQDEDGVWTTPTGSLVAWFQDPDGNVLSFSQH